MNNGIIEQKNVDFKTKFAKNPPFSFLKNKECK
jgi:hypothetical protein